MTSIIDHDLGLRDVDLVTAWDWMRRYTWVWNGVTYCNIQSLSRLHNNRIMKVIRVWQLTIHELFPVPIICEVTLEYNDVETRHVTLVDMTDREFIKAVSTHV